MKKTSHLENKKKSIILLCISKPKKLVAMVSSTAIRKWIKFSPLSKKLKNLGVTPIRNWPRLQIATMTGAAQKLSLKRVTVSPDKDNWISVSSEFYFWKCITEKNFFLFYKFIKKSFFFKPFGRKIVWSYSIKAKPWKPKNWFLNLNTCWAVLLK